FPKLPLWTAAYNPTAPCTRPVVEFISVRNMMDFASRQSIKRTYLFPLWTALAQLGVTLASRLAWLAHAIGRTPPRLGPDDTIMANKPRTSLECTSVAKLIVAAVLLRAIPVPSYGKGNAEMTS